MRLLPAIIIVLLTLSWLPVYPSSAQSEWPEPPLTPTTAYILASLPYHIEDEDRINYIESPGGDGFIVFSEAAGENGSDLLVLRMFDWDLKLKWRLELEYAPIKFVYADDDLMGHPAIVLHLSRPPVSKLIVVDVEAGTVVESVDLVEVFGKRSSIILSSLYLSNEDILVMLLNNWTEDYTGIQFSVAALDLETGRLLWKYYEPERVHHILPLARWNNSIVVANSVWNETSRAYDSILYEFNLMTGEAARETIYSSQNETIGVPSPYDEKILIMTTNPPLHAVIYDYRTRTIRPIDGFNESRINWLNVHWSPNGRYVALTGDLGGDRYTFRIVDLDEESIVYTTISEDYEVEKIVYQDNGSIVSAIIPRDGPDRLVVIDLASNETVLDRSVGPFNDFSWSRDGSRLYVIVTGYRGYPTLYVYDADNDYTLIDESIVFHPHHFEKIIVGGMGGTPNVYLFDYQRLTGDIYIYHLIEEPTSILKYKYQYDAKTWRYVIVAYARIYPWEVRQLGYKWIVQCNGSEYEVRVEGYMVPAYYYTYRKSSSDANWTSHEASIGILVPVNITIRKLGPIQPCNITILFYQENETKPTRIYALVDPTHGFTTIALRSGLRVWQNVTVLRVETWSGMNDTISMSLLLTIPIEDYTAYNPDMLNQFKITTNITSQEERSEQPSQNTTTPPPTTTTTVTTARPGTTTTTTKTTASNTQAKNQITTSTKPSTTQPQHEEETRGESRGSTGNTILVAAGLIALIAAAIIAFYTRRS